MKTLQKLFVVNVVDNAYGYRKLNLTVVRGSDTHFSCPRADFTWQANQDSPDRFYGLHFLVNSGNFEDVRLVSNVGKQVFDGIPTKHYSQVTPEEFIEALEEHGYQRAVYIQSIGRYVANKSIKENTDIFSVRLDGSKSIHSCILSTYQDATDKAMRLFPENDVKVEHLENAYQYKDKMNF